MTTNANSNIPESTVCGQAQAVLDILARTGLPAGLSLSIEEILECAWEIAYRHCRPTGAAPVTDLAAARALREHSRAASRTQSA